MADPTPPPTETIPDTQDRADSSQHEALISSADFTASPRQREYARLKNHKSSCPHPGHTDSPSAFPQQCEIPAAQTPPHPHGHPDKPAAPRQTAAFHAESVHTPMPWPHSPYTACNAL